MAWSKQKFYSTQGGWFQNALQSLRHDNGYDIPQLLKARDLLRNRDDNKFTYTTIEKVFHNDDDDNEITLTALTVLTKMLKTSNL